MHNAQLTIPTPEELDAILRQDFLAFWAKCFTTLNPARRLLHNWHLEVLAHALEKVRSGRCRRLIINIPPRYGKSLMASVAFPAYFLGHDPTKRVLCASYAQDLAAKHSRDCRTLMETPWYRALFPGAALDPTHKAECDFATLKRGGRYATSVGGVMTGLGGDVVIIDDPMKPGDASSEKARANVIEWFNNTVSTRLDDKHRGAIIVIMQRLHVDDLAGELLRAGGWEMLNIAAIAPAEQIYPLGDHHHYRRREGEVLHPAYESEESLKQLKRTMGGLVFEAQYQQNPMPVEGAQIKADWLRYYSRPPARVCGGPLYQSWDTASTDNEFSDYSACTTWYVDEGKFYLLDVLRVKYTFPELLQLVTRHAHKWNCSRILIEEKGAGQHLIQSFENTLRGVIPFKPVGSKIMRLAAASPAFEAGDILFPKSAPWLDDLIVELLQFPNARHDDQVDSISQFLNYWDQRDYNMIRVVPFS